jgi:hypothetical protein
MDRNQILAAVLQRIVNIQGVPLSSTREILYVSVATASMVAAHWNTSRRSCEIELSEYGVN